MDRAILAAALRRRHSSRGMATRRLFMEALEDRALLTALTTPPAYVPDQILIGFAGDVPAVFQTQGAASVAQLAAARFKPFGLSKGDILLDAPASGGAPEHLITRWNVPAGKDIVSLAHQIAALPGVTYAEPNYIWTADALIPNDPQFSSLWGLNNTGQSGGTFDADIDAPEAWDITTGSSNVIVGIIDTGVDYNHPDLKANIWTNPGEIANNGIDDDKDGYIDDIHGINAITGSGDPMDDNDHGTHVAGTIGALGNNGIGVAGVNHHVSIAAAKFLGADGSGTTADAIECFNYFNKLKQAGQNIVVTNNSWGGGGFSLALMDAMRGPAGMKPILHAVAAGNSDNNNDLSPSYPSSYDLPNIIAVAATDRTDQYASFSSYGATSVDIAAPGVKITSTTPNNTYSTFSGTSMATPHVTGAAALVASMYPNLSAVQLKQALLDGVDDISSIGANASKPTVTGGRLNVYQTLTNLADNDTTPPAAIANLAVSGPGISALTLNWTATGDDGLVGTARHYDLRYSTVPITDATWAVATAVSNEPLPKTAGQAESFRVTGLASNTTYYFALKARDNLGNESPLSNVAVGSTVAGQVIRSDNFESGLSQWTAQSPWGATTTSKHTGATSVTDSPVGNYNNNVNSSLISTPLNLTDARQTQLSFWHRYSLEPDYDYARVEVSTNGGVNWTTLATYNGTLSTFQKATVDLSAYDGKPSVLIRFRLQSDWSIRYDGWYIDDFEVVCLPNPSIKVTPTTGLTTTESGGAATFTVVLSGPQPTADVVVPLSSSNPSEGTLSAASLTFTPANWNIPQTVTVTGVDDALFDGDVAYTIVIGPAASSDPHFDGLNPADVAVTNRDNDTKFLVVNDGAPDRTYSYGLAGNTVGNYANSAGNTAPRGIASTAAGDTTWVVDANKRVYVYNTSGGLLGWWSAGSVPSNADVQGITVNGADVWIVDNRGDRVYRYANAATRLTGTQTATSSFALNGANTNPRDLVTDGTSIWVVNDSNTDKVFKYNLAGALLGSWTITAAGASPSGITIDPTNVSNIWIVDSASRRVYQFNNAAALTSGSLGPATSFALAPTNTNPQGITDPPLVGRSGPDRPASQITLGLPAASPLDSALLALLQDLDSLLGRKRK